MDTYTRPQAMTALGITSHSAFHHLRKKYPAAFVIVKQGYGRKNFTLYDKAALDKFIEWRHMLKSYETYRAALAKIEPKNIQPLMKGKQS